MQGMHQRGGTWRDGTATAVVQTRYGIRFQLGLKAAE